MTATQDMDGAALIAAERQRQVEAEGWTPEHDDDHDSSELVQAARAYAMVYNFPSSLSSSPSVADHVGWPWHADWWKPSDDPVANLVKAGALIAAEIDRLQRGSSGSTGEDG